MTAEACHHPALPRSTNWFSRAWHLLVEANRQGFVSADAAQTRLLADWQTRTWASAPSEEVRDAYHQLGRRRDPL